MSSELGDYMQYLALLSILMISFAPISTLIGSILLSLAHKPRHKQGFVLLPSRVLRFSVCIAAGSAISTILILLYGLGAGTNNTGVAALVLFTPVPLCGLCYCVGVYYQSRRSKNEGMGCGRCAYPANGLTNMSCPECGADFREVGLLPT